MNFQNLSGEFKCRPCTNKIQFHIHGEVQNLILNDFGKNTVLHQKLYFLKQNTSNLFFIHFALTSNTSFVVPFTVES
jgi:hypothetical protein